MKNQDQKFLEESLTKYNELDSKDKLYNPFNKDKDNNIKKKRIYCDCL